MPSSGTGDLSVSELSGCSSSGYSVFLQVTSCSVSVNAEVGFKVSETAAGLVADNELLDLLRRQSGLLLSDGGRSCSLLGNWLIRETI